MASAMANAKDARGQPLLGGADGDAAVTRGVDGGFVQADHGPEGTGDEMQFVLNDQVRRQEWFGQRLPGGVARRSCRAELTGGVDWQSCQAELPG